MRVSPGTATSVTLGANSSVNLNQVGGNAVAVGNGLTTNGTLRVTISSDSTGQVALASGTNVIGHVITDAGSVTNATLSAETTKVIGVVRTSDGSGNLLTSNSTTTTAKTALDTNIISILGTAPTTAGFIDIKGADGNVFVRQATATNLKTQANMYDGSGNAVTSNSTTTTSKTAPDVNILSILGTAPTTAGFIDIKGADGNVFVRQTTGSNLHVVTDSGTITTVSTVSNVAQINGNNITAASTTTTSKTGLDSNILSILGTAPTTAGKLDVKGADGDVFVRQSTASNLKATVNIQDGAGNALTSNSSTTTSKTALDSNILSILGTVASTAASGTILVGNADGSGNKITSASTTTTSKTGLDTNILSILGTAPTTAGKLDIKGADGDVFVRQATASNLKATVNIQDGAGNALTSNSTTTTSKTALDSNILSVLGTIASTAAGGTLLIGVSDGSGTKITSASTTTTSKTGLDANILSILGTAPTTAGKLDVKGADGDVFVRQSTASNLKATVNNQDGAGNALTSNSTTTTSKTALDSNILSILGTVANTAASGTILVGLSDGAGAKLTSNSTTTTSKTAIDVNILSVLGTVPSAAGFLNITPASNAGWSFKYVAGGLSSTKTQLKSTAGTFGGWAWLYNPNTAATYIQVFNKASANVTVGSTTPDFVIVLPGVATASATGSAANAEIAMGIAMSTGITVAATTTETGSTAPANAVFVTFLYI